MPEHKRNVARALERMPEGDQEALTRIIREFLTREAEIDTHFALPAV